jgi:hypothetical protein
LLLDRPIRWSFRSAQLFRRTCEDACLFAQSNCVGRCSLSRVP